MNTTFINRLSTLCKQYCGEINEQKLLVHYVQLFVDVIQPVEQPDTENYATIVFHAGFDIEKISKTKMTSIYKYFDKTQIDNSGIDGKELTNVATILLNEDTYNFNDWSDAKKQYKPIVDKVVDMLYHAISTTKNKTTRQGKEEPNKQE